MKAEELEMEFDGFVVTYTPIEEAYDDTDDHWEMTSSGPHRTTVETVSMRIVDVEIHLVEKDAEPVAWDKSFRKEFLLWLQYQ